MSGQVELLTDDDLVYEEDGEASWPMSFAYRIFATTLDFTCPSCGVSLSYCPTEDERWTSICEDAARSGLEYQCASCDAVCFLFFRTQAEVRIACSGLRVESRSTLRSPAVLDLGLDDDVAIDALSIRCRQILAREGFLYVGDLVHKSEEDLRALRGCGAVTLHEIRKMLAKLSLSFGMNVDWQRPGGPLPQTETAPAFDGPSASLVRGSVRSNGQTP